MFTIDQVNNKVKPLNEEKAGLLKELATLNASAGRLSKEEAIEAIERCAEAIENGDFNEIRTTLEGLIYYIELNNEDIKIHWKFA